MNEILKEPSSKEGYLSGKLLLAMPTMRDPRFENAVIYLCSHDENGAMGLIINHALPGMQFKHLLNELDIASDIEVDPNVLQTPLMNGGPVDTGRGFLLHSADFQVKESISMDDQIYISGTIDSLKAMAKGSGPQERLIMFGYAGWSAGQLDEEIQNNSWLVSDADPKLIFGDAHDEKWQKAVSGLGFDPSMLSGEAGRA